MKILLASHPFSPSTGGIETCSMELALAFVKLGHEVRVLTQTTSNNPKEDCELYVVRRPNDYDLFQLMRWCDVFFQNNISLKTAWPLIFLRKPWVVCTATWIQNPNGSIGPGERIKKFALRFATNVYISRAVRDHVGYEGFMVPNPYDDRTFRIIPGVRRENSLAFVGRLVSDKGCDLLIQSLARLRERGLILPLSIIGKGPEESRLKSLVVDEKLERQVHFAGVLKGEELARELNRHKVLVIPSRWNEPFGVVALEGIACGCMVIGSAGGGLPDAIGPCGATFKNGDLDQLTNAIAEVVQREEVVERYKAAQADHLNGHKKEYIATRYIEVFCNGLAGQLP